jgi:hypothetical protein
VCRGRRRGGEGEEARRSCMAMWRESKGRPAASWMKKLPEGTGVPCHAVRRQRDMGLLLAGRAALEKFTGPA